MFSLVVNCKLLIIIIKAVTSYLNIKYSYIMWFTIWRTGDLNTNERMVAFYKKELWASHIVDKAKKQKHYGTKWYRKFVQYDFPSARRYKRIRAIVSSAYRKTKEKYTVLSQLGKRI